MPEHKIEEVDILNLALDLEYLEAEFYTHVTTGKSITSFGIGINGRANGANPTTGGTTVGGKKVNFSEDEAFLHDIAAQIGADERAHVVLLRGALGSSAVAMPNIDLGALGFGFDNHSDFLRAARILEDIGVTAYSGAAGLLKTPDLLTAACLLGAEAEHAAAIRTHIARLKIPTTALDGVDLVPPPQRRGEAGPLDQSQRWAHRGEDGWTGALSRVWRQGRGQTGRLFPDWSQRHNRLEHGESYALKGCCVTICSRRTAPDKARPNSTKFRQRGRPYFCAIRSRLAAHKSHPHFLAD